MSSCLNSCGDCGRAYQRAGLQPHRHEEVARALGGGPGERRRLDLDEASLEQHVAGGRVDLRSAAAARRPARGGAGRGSGSAAAPPRRPATCSSSWNGSGAASLSTSTLVGDHLDLAGRQRGVLVALGPDAHLADDPDAVLGAQRRATASSSRTTTWTTPEASRRSRKATPPWSRRRATQPASVTVSPACSARSVPASCVRITAGFSRRCADEAVERDGDLLAAWPGP